MAYITQAKFIAELPNEFLTEALDDDRDAVNDADLFDTILESAEEKVNAVLEAKGVALPLSSPYPNPVVNAARMLVLEKFWDRRGKTGDDNPWAAKAEDALKLLKEWAEDPGISGDGGVSWGSDTLIDL